MVDDDKIHWCIDSVTSAWVRNNSVLSVVMHRSEPVAVSRPA